jgi:hypothetical protein
MHHVGGKVLMITGKTNNICSHAMQAQQQHASSSRPSRAMRGAMVAAVLADVAGDTAMYACLGFAMTAA